MDLQIIPAPLQPRHEGERAQSSKQNNPGPPYLAAPGCHPSLPACLPACLLACLPACCLDSLSSSLLPSKQHPATPSNTQQYPAAPSNT